MFDQSLKVVMKENRKKFITASPTDSVNTAAKLMRTKGLGALLLVEDALFRVLAMGLDPNGTTLREVMTADPITLGPEKTYGHALIVMHENGFRHIPVVEDAKAVGIVSSRDAMDPDMQECIWQERQRAHHR